MNLFHKPLFMSTKWLDRARIFFLEKLLKCYVLVKKFDRNPAISLIENSYGRIFSHATLTKLRIFGAAGAPKSFLYGC